MRENDIPAFPVADVMMAEPKTTAESKAWARGMTLRDFFAAKALPAAYEAAVNDCNQNGWPTGWRLGVALDAYRMADEMLAARDAFPPPPV